MAEYAQYQGSIDQKFLCITDHGTMGAVPQQISECEKHKLFPLFGCEMYVNQMQPESSGRVETAEFRKNLDDAQKKRFDKSSHILGIAYNNTGYQNLVRLTSWAWIHGFYRKPRVNHQVLQKYKEGIIFTSTCANSEIANAYMPQVVVGYDDKEKPIYETRFDEEAGMAMLEKYMAMFGQHFYLELMMLDYKMQKPYDRFLLKAHDKYHIPLIMTQDCHYCRREHSHNQRLMLMQQNKKTLAEIEALKASDEGADLFELQDSNLWLKSETELNEMWLLEYRDVIDYELYKQSKANTVKICEMAKGVQIDRGLKLPRLPDSEEMLWEETIKGFHMRGCPDNDTYHKRIREEYDLIKEKGFSSYFLIQKMMTDIARAEGPNIIGFGDGSECVGPGRGSVCGSLLAYCLRLHDVEPIYHDLRFSRFLSPARGGKQTKFRHSISPVPHMDVML